MATFSTIDQLKACRSYTGHWIDKVHTKALTSSGGYFAWDATYTGPEYYSLIVKPTTAAPNGIGAWKRQFSGGVNVDWFGATHDSTLASTMWTQAQANVIFGQRQTLSGNAPNFTYANLVDVNRDTLDTVAAKYALNLLGDFTQVVEYSPAIYHISNDCYYPDYQGYTNATGLEYIIEGNGCTLVADTTNAFTFINGYDGANLSAAESFMTPFAIKIRNFNITGGPSAFSQTGIKIRPSYASSVTDCVIKAVARGIVCHFALAATVARNRISSSICGIEIGVAFNSDGAQSNAASLTDNRTVCYEKNITNNYYQNYNYTTCNVLVDRCSSVTIDNHIFDAGYAADYDLIVDAGSSTVVRNFRISNMHFESAAITAHLWFRNCLNGTYTAEGFSGDVGTVWSVPGFYIPFTGAGILARVNAADTHTIFNFDELVRWTRIQYIPQPGYPTVASWLNVANPVYWEGTSDPANPTSGNLIVPGSGGVPSTTIAYRNTTTGRLFMWRAGANKWEITNVWYKTLANSNLNKLMWSSNSGPNESSNSNHTIIFGDRYTEGLSIGQPVDLWRSPETYFVDAGQTTPVPAPTIIANQSPPASVTGYPTTAQWVNGAFDYNSAGYINVIQAGAWVAKSATNSGFSHSALVVKHNPGLVT